MDWLPELTCACILSTMNVLELAHWCRDHPSNGVNRNTPKYANPKREFFFFFFTKDKSSELTQLICSHCRDASSSLTLLEDGPSGLSCPSLQVIGKAPKDPWEYSAHESTSGNNKNWHVLNGLGTCAVLHVLSHLLFTVTPWGRPYCHHVLHMRKPQ